MAQLESHNALHQPSILVSLSFQVNYVGAIIGAIVADSKEHAQRAAKAVHVVYEELDPILSIQVEFPLLPYKEFACFHLGMVRSVQV